MEQPSPLLSNLFPWLLPIYRLVFFHGLIFWQFLWGSGILAFRIARRSDFYKTIKKIFFKDLDRYYKTVDDSIIEFHQHKMEQINSILSELWARVYQGNDIETIKIKSQTVGSAEKKKSYDYRFCFDFYFFKKIFN